MEKILSNKKIHEKIHKNGYAYNFDKSSANTKYYLCERCVSMHEPIFVCKNDVHILGLLLSVDRAIVFIRSIN